MGNVNKYGNPAGKQSEGGVTFATIYAISVACPSDSTDGIALLNNIDMLWKWREPVTSSEKCSRGLIVVGPLIANALACFES